MGVCCVELDGQDKRIAGLLKEAEAVLWVDRERGVVVSVQTYSTLIQRMQEAKAAEKASNPLKKFTAASDLAIILGAFKSELHGAKSMSGLLNKARDLLDEISACPEMLDKDGRNRLDKKAKTEILWELREQARAEKRKFTLVSGELNPNVIKIVIEKAGERAGAPVPERILERYRVHQGRASFAYR